MTACEGPALARKAGPAENAAITAPLAADCRASGEESAPLDEAAARRLTLGIQLRLETVAANIEQVIPLIEQARDGNAHEALGYKSWTAYVQDKFGGRLARLQRAQRQPIVELLAATGMPTRAIGSFVGVSHETVAADIRAAPSGVRNLTPEDLGLPPDGMADAMLMADATEEEFENALTAAKAEEDISRENLVSKLGQRQVTGTDGKTYTVKPKPYRREPSDAERRAADERRARSDLYSGIAKCVQTAAVYGQYQDIPKLMADFDPAELNPPQYEREFRPASLRAAARLMTELIEWAEARQCGDT